MAKILYLRDYGSSLIRRGHNIVPIKPGTKYPKGVDNWQQLQADDATLAMWLRNGFADGGVGVLTKRTPAIDIDVQDRDIVNQLIGWIRKNLGDTVQRVGQAPKTLLVFRTEQPFSKVQSATYEDFLGQRHKVEVLADGQQFVAFAIHPDTKQPYQWVDKTLADVDYNDLPTLSLEQAQAFVSYFESIIPEDWELAEKGHSGKQLQHLGLTKDERVLLNSKPKVDLDTRKLKQALKRIDADDYRTWTEVGMGLFHQYDGDVEGFILWDEWAQSSDKYDASEMAHKWASFRPDLSRQEPITAATIIKLAKDAYRLEKSQEINTRGFNLRHVTETISKLSAIRWQIKGFVESDSTGLLFGDPGSFKSFMALDMALSVACGIDWQGKKTKQGAAIYIAGEGHGGLARRIEAWRREHSVDLTSQPFYLSSQSANFCDEEGVDLVVDAIDSIAQHSGSPSMIVIDTLARNFGAGDENSTADMNVFIEHVDNRIRDKYNCVVLIVHHTGRANKERARGSIALTGGMDFEYRLSRLEGSSVVELTCTKMKDAIEPKTSFYKAKEVPIGSFEDDDGDVEFVTSLVLEQCAEPVEEVNLKGNQLVLFEHIKAMLSVSDSELKTAIRDDVVESGLLTSGQFKKAIHTLIQKEILIENSGNIEINELYINGE